MAPRHISIEYLAGFIDGEGWLGTMGRGKQGKRTHYGSPVPLLGIANTKREVLDLIKESFPNTSKIFTMWRDPKRPEWAQAYQLRFYSTGLREYLPLLIPHLIVKRRQAEFMLRYVTMLERKAPGAKNRSPWTQYEQKQLLDLIEKIHLLNKKGFEAQKTAEESEIILPKSPAKKGRTLTMDEFLEQSITNKNTDSS